MIEVDCSRDAWRCVCVCPGEFSLQFGESAPMVAKMTAWPVVLKLLAQFTYSIQSDILSGVRGRCQAFEGMGGGTQIQDAAKK